VKGNRWGTKPNPEIWKNLGRCWKESLIREDFVCEKLLRPISLYLMDNIKINHSRMNLFSSFDKVYIILIPRPLLDLFLFYAL